MTTDKFCFYLQNRLIQTSQTGGQWYSDASPLVFPASTLVRDMQSNASDRVPMGTYGYLWVPMGF